MSPIPGFHTAAAVLSITFICICLATVISRRGTAPEINDNEEVVTVTGRKRLHQVVVALLQAVAAATSTGAAAVLG